MNRNVFFKYLLFGIAILFSLFLFFGVKTATKNLKDREKAKVLIWTRALEKKSAVLELTKNLFDKLKLEEKDKVELWSEAIQLLLANQHGGNVSILLKIISTNRNIPIVLVDDNHRIVSSANIDFVMPADNIFSDSLVALFSAHPPLLIKNEKWPTSYLYYNDSRLYSQLQYVFDDFVQSFISDIIENAVSVPVIITDSMQSTILFSGNVGKQQLQTASDTVSFIGMMTHKNTSIGITLYGSMPAFVYYEDSNLLFLMQYVPVATVLMLSLFLIASLIALKTSRVSDQNLLWVGMSKETAHQLGTPISSLMAWSELIRMNDPGSFIADEMDKDISRLRTITERFSKIGSEPKLTEVDFCAVIENAVSYMQARTSSEVKFEFTNTMDGRVTVPLNIDLFEWCIENIIRNAVDAMSGEGSIYITLSSSESSVHVDITDTGKGMSRRIFKKIFSPGFTSKSRGWGLGLSLSRRIITDYHRGKIFVKRSEINVGTTFRILLPKRLSNRK